MSKKVYGVLCNDSENKQFVCLADGYGLFISNDDDEPDSGNFASTPVSKKQANEFVERMSYLYPNNIYTVFKMKFKETI